MRYSFGAVVPETSRHRNLGLRGRQAECDELKHLLAAVRRGESRVLVVHGEAGFGKTALLDYVAEQAKACQVARASGVESEMELAYAALHQLCGPMLDRLDRLPAPQREALSTAFGLSTGPAPDRLLVGLAVLSMLADVAETRPLVCLVDDLQWLDQASVQVISFVARRLVAESVALIVASRLPHPEMRTLPEMPIGGLRESDARALLDAVLSVPLDERVRDQIVVETGGNPLALLELPRRLSVQELAGGFGLPGTMALSTAMETSFQRGVDAVPEQTRRLLLLAAAEPLGDPRLLWPAAARLGIGADAAAPAVEAGLAEFGVRVRFRHPLVRSAVYRSASLHDRQVAHGALAEVTDSRHDPDRRAWHLAHAAAGPDDDVADELERSSGRARARGGLAAAAAFHQRAATLTLDPALRSERALAAASAQVEAGAFDAALDLLAMAEGGPLNDFQRARADLVRARLAHVTGRGSDAPPLLLKAAERLQPIDAGLSRTTYVEAFSAAMFAGVLAAGGGVREVAHAAETSPTPAAPRLPDLLLDGLCAHYNSGYTAGLPILRRAVDTARSETTSEQQLRWMWLTGIAALHVWDDESWDVLTARHVEFAREAGALTELPLALSSRAVMMLFSGDLTAVEAMNQEAQTVKDATGDSLTPYGALTLAAFRGRRSEAAVLIAETNRDVLRRGEGVGLTVARWAEAVLDNGIGDYRAAMGAAVRATEPEPFDLGVSPWAAVELVEAAARCGELDIAARALAGLTEMTSASGTDWALGIQARSQALLTEGADAETLYAEAIERLGRTRIRTELARSHLLSGEWLRRERRHTEARAQLRIAHGMLDAMGMEAFAERAHRELQAAGGTTRQRVAGSSGRQLTSQEDQVAQLARDGLTNPEIGARLYISARTVQYHLRKVFAKLGISSRSQLDRVLGTDSAWPGGARG
ncbi:AAA family ATPase [Mycobacterium sp. URHB0021]